jgi:hypothetical protein
MLPGPWSFEKEGVISGAPQRFITRGKLWVARLDVGKIQ